MSRRRTFRVDLLSGDLAAALLLGAVFFLGGTAGCIAAAGIGGEAGTALQEYLEAYLTLAREGQVETHFWPVLWEQMRCPLFILLLGFTSLGVLGIPVLFGIRGFLFAFSVACFCRLFGLTGLIPAMFLFGIPALLWIPAFFVLGVQALCSACRLSGRWTGEGREPLFRQGSFWVRCGLCAGAVLLCVLFECMALPVLVGASAGFVL